MAIDTIVIGCMDRRLNGYIDENFNNDHTYILRNAGANVHTLEESIRNIVQNEPIVRIVLLPHTSSSPEGVKDGDCGAMKFTSAAVKDGKKVSEAVEDGLVAQFRGLSFGSVHELEIVNQKLQMAALQRILEEEVAKPKTAENPRKMARMPLISSILVDTSKLDVVDDKDHALMLARPSDMRYSAMLAGVRTAGLDLGLDSTYVIQASGLKAVAQDVEIAASALQLDGHHHKIVAFVRDFERDSFRRDVEELRHSTFFVHRPTITEVEFVTKKSAKKQTPHVIV